MRGSLIIGAAIIIGAGLIAGAVVYNGRFHILSWKGQPIIVDRWERTGLLCKDDLALEPKCFAVDFLPYR